MEYTKVKVPEYGEKITIQEGKLHVPDHPIIPFVEGDGTGRDIWRASVRVLDAAVQKAYQGRRYRISKTWMALRRRLTWISFPSARPSFTKE